MLSIAAHFTCEPVRRWATTSFLTIMLFRRVFAISCATLVLFTFTYCVLLSNIDSLNEVRQISTYVHILAVPLHHGSTLSLRVHVHVRLLCSLFLCNLPDS